jgi:uncharacterized protein YceK
MYTEFLKRLARSQVHDITVICGCGSINKTTTNTPKPGHYTPETASLAPKDRVRCYLPSMPV